MRAEGLTLAQLPAQVGLDRPVLLAEEALDLPLAVDDHPQRHRLYAAGRESAPHLLPEQRADLVADEAVEDASGLLGVNERLVDLAWVLEGVAHCGRRDL